MSWLEPKRLPQVNHGLLWLTLLEQRDSKVSSCIRVIGSDVDRSGEKRRRLLEPPLSR